MLARVLAAEASEETTALFQAGRIMCSQTLRVEAEGSRRPLRAVLARVLAAEASGETAALVRSTLALTQLDTPGAAGNVVPAVARARFNARLLPGTGRHQGVGFTCDACVATKPDIARAGSNARLVLGAGSQKRA